MSLGSRIVFQNEFLVAVDKPADWLTVPSRFEKNDDRKILGRELERHLNRRIFPVHRLDFEVSGLVLFALDARAHQKANDWFSGKEITKVYQALSGARDFAHWPENLDRADEPVPEGEIVEWRCKIMRGKRRTYEHPKGDSSLTRASRREKDGVHQWQLFPVTGRSHQLRFELSRHGFPIKGDALYGSKEKFAEGGIALRAVRLDFSQIDKAARLGCPERIEVEGFFSGWSFP